MSIEEDINEAFKNLTFFKNLPEFIDRAKHLEERLKSGEKLEVRMDEYEVGPHSIDAISLVYYKAEGKIWTPLILNCLGDIFSNEYLFEHYRLLPKSQRV